MESIAEEIESQAAAPADTPVEELSAEELLPGQPEGATSASTADAELKAVIEAIVYITDEPLSMEQIAAALGQPRERVSTLLDELVREFEKPEHGLSLREIAGGFKMTKIGRAHV